MGSETKLTGEKNLKKIVDSLDYLNEKGKKKAFNRGKEIIEILNDISKFRGLNELEDLARQEFRFSINRFFLGFYGDSIRHAVFSIEMGLLIRLERELSIDEKEMIHGEINRRKKTIIIYFW